MKKQLLLLLIFFYSVSGFSQLVEGFENTTGPDPVPSSNWTLGSGNWAVFDNGIAGAVRWNKTSVITTPPSVNQGSNAAFVGTENIGMGNTSEDWLVTPVLVVPLDGVLRFHSRMGTAGDQGTLFQIRIAPAGCDVPSCYLLVQEFTESTLNIGSFDLYEEKVVDLSAFAGVSVSIAFVRKYMQPTAATGGDSWYIDDVSNMPASDALILSAFVDTNSNGIKDSGEQNFNYGNFVYQINASGANLYGNTNSGNFLIFDTNPTNSYNISFAVNPAFSPYVSCVTTYNGITLPVGSGYNYLYFPVTVTTPYIDAGVSLYNSNNPRPGFYYYTNIRYTNYGLNTIANGTLSFTKDPNLTISTVSQPGIVNTPTGFTYDFTNLAPGENRTIQVSLSVPTIPIVTLGQLVTNSVSIQTAGDINNSNDLATNTQAIVGSYDPNDITESHGGKIGLDTFTDNDYLYYTIRFENTGTANAEFIRVEDLLDDDLDHNTFEMLAASHDVNTLRSDNQLTWHFYDINLPPTISNPDDSHGYIHFRIKPKTGYAAGDVIPNTAQIYFDFNPAIVTNTFDTEFFETLGNPSFNGNEFNLYPNPTSELVSISNTTEKIVTVAIYEVSGKRIYTLDKNTLSTISIDVSNFARGLYLVELTSENNTTITKKLLLK